MTCLNFAGTGSRILLHPLCSSRTVKPLRKIALNSNGEVNCRELARRPCMLHDLISNFKRICQDFVNVLWIRSLIHVDLICERNFEIGFIVFEYSSFDFSAQFFL